MTSSLKDVSSADMVRNMAEMGCFEQAYIVYGYSWREKTGKRFYRMSQDDTLIQQAFEKQLIEQYCLTPIQQWSTRAILAEESKEEQLFYFRLQLARQLQQDYNAYYFNSLAELQQVPADSRAESMLLQWQEEIDGYFNEDALTLFAGAVQYAYLAKHLSVQGYQQIQQWLHWTKVQNTNHPHFKDHFERTFYGVAYRNVKEQSCRFLCNANKKAFDHQINELKKKGLQCTPVYQKTYWYHQSTDLPNVRKLFEKDLQNVMDDSYLQRMVSLQSLSSAIPDDLWKSCLQQIQQNCSGIAVAEFEFWRQLWNIVN